MITAETTIAKVIMTKGEKAAEMIDAALCNEGETCQPGACCPGSSLQLGYAARLMDRSEQLPGLLESLNAL